MPLTALPDDVSSANALSRKPVCAWRSGFVSQCAAIPMQVSPADDDKGIASVLADLNAAKAMLQVRLSRCSALVLTAVAGGHAQRAPAVQRAYVVDRVPATVHENPKLEVR